jgi:hypothetical protein
MPGESLENSQLMNQPDACWELAQVEEASLWKKRTLTNTLEQNSLLKT